MIALQAVIHYNVNPRCEAPVSCTCIHKKCVCRVAMYNSPVEILCIATKIMWTKPTRFLCAFEPRVMWICTDLHECHSTTVELCELQLKLCESNQQGVMCIGNESCVHCWHVSTSNNVHSQGECTLFSDEMRCLNWLNISSIMCICHSNYALFKLCAHPHPPPFHLSHVSNR